MNPKTKNKMNAILVKLLISVILMAVFYFWFSSRLNELTEISHYNVAKPVIIEKEAPLKESGK